MLRCPRCQSSKIYRTPTESAWSRLRRRLTIRRPHVCQACGWRGWGEETGPKFSEEQIRAASLAFDEPLDVRGQLAQLSMPQETTLASHAFELPAEIAADQGRPQPKKKGILFDDIDDWRTASAD